jgi:hypothetical protein
MSRLTLEMIVGLSPRRAAAVRALAQLPPPWTCPQQHTGPVCWTQLQWLLSPRCDKYSVPQHALRDDSAALAQLPHCLGVLQQCQQLLAPGSAGEPCDTQRATLHFSAIYDGLLAVTHFSQTVGPMKLPYRHPAAHLQGVCPQLLVWVWESSNRRQVVHTTAATTNYFDASLVLSWSLQ